MRIPELPPNEESFESFLTNEPEKARQALVNVHSPLVNGKYLHWDKFKYHPPPEGLSVVQWWGLVKFRRRAGFKKLPLWDKNHVKFVYFLTEFAAEVLHRIDLGAGGRIQIPEPLANPDTRDQYYVSSLIEEAITSSQIEGASTTRVIAKDMIRAGRQPRDKSERMIFNNYRAMREIGQIKDQPLTPKLISHLHRIVTEGTLDDPSAAGRFRTETENIRIENFEGQVIHVPPAASELEARMERLCHLANKELPEEFLHPVIRSIMLHFFLAYDHPFVDGNGRTARALFYWSMLHNHYWLFEYISISQIIKKGLIKYGRAFLHTETDENDMTYFIIYHLDVINRAIKELHSYLQRKSAQLRQLEKELKGMAFLNHRQRALISHALRHPNHRYTIQSHRLSHNVVYQTARSDLLDLQERGMLVGGKTGKTWSFTPAANLGAKLSTMNPP